MSANEVERALFSNEHYEAVVEDLVNSDDDKDNLSSSIPSKATIEISTGVSQFKIGGPSSDYGGYEYTMTNPDSHSLKYNFGTSSLQEHEGSQFDESDASSQNWGHSEASFSNFRSDSYGYYNPGDISRMGSGSSAVYSDYQAEDYNYDQSIQPWNEVPKDVPVFTIRLHAYEGLPKVSDFLSKQIDDLSHRCLRIECEEGQLTEDNIQIIFKQFTSVTKIDLVDLESDSVFKTFHPTYSGAHHIYDGFSPAPNNNFSSPAMKIGPKESYRHQKCKSLSESKKFKDRLEDASSSKEMKPFNKKKGQKKKKPRGGSTRSQNTQTHKFTCRYDIQITNEDFKVGKRIIGTKGKNMKAIVSEWAALGNALFLKENIKQTDFAKLRLRGKGSQYFEGSRNQESNEPLHLWVSSKYKETFDKACELTESLINDVYEQYYKYSKSIQQRGEFPPKSMHNSDKKKPYQQTRLISPDYGNYGVSDPKTPMRFSSSQPNSIRKIGPVKASHHIKSNFAGRKLPSDSLRKGSGGKGPFMGFTQPDFNQSG